MRVCTRRISKASKYTAKEILSFVRKNVKVRHSSSISKREISVALLPVVGQDAMIPVGDNDTSTPSGPQKQRENAHPRLRKNVGGFYDACLPAGCLMHHIV